MITPELYLHFRTYPSSYVGVDKINSHSSTLITNANGTVKCVVSQAVMTREFLLHKYISNGLELTPYFDRRCEVGEVSPPLVLVRVSSLTATTTNYFDSPEARTSSAKNALPSNSLSPPTAPQTEPSMPDSRPTTVLASPPPRITADVPSITSSFAPSEPVHSDLLGSVSLATTLIATGNREAEPSTKTGIPDQHQELGNGNLASRPGEPTPTVPVSKFPPTRPVFGTIQTVALSPDSSLPIRLSSIVNPTDNFPISDRILSGLNSRLVTDPTSLGLLELSIDNPRPTSLPHLPSILTFTNQESTVPNPSDFFLSGTPEIHRGGSTIITSGTRSISLGNSATIIVDDSSITPPAVHIVGSLSKVPGTQVTANSTFALPPAATSAGNLSQLFPGGQTKLAEVPMFIMFGATFLGIAAPWGLRHI